jgi:hypothetical protein
VRDEDAAGRLAIRGSAVALIPLLFPRLASLSAGYDFGPEIRYRCDGRALLSNGRCDARGAAFFFRPMEARGREAMGYSEFDPAAENRRAWNAGRKVGAKRPLKPQQVWAIRFWLDRERRLRDRAMFDLAIDSKLRGGRRGLRRQMNKRPSIESWRDQTNSAQWGSSSEA